MGVGVVRFGHHDHDVAVLNCPHFEHHDHLVAVKYLRFDQIVAGNIAVKFGHCPVAVVVYGLCRLSNAPVVQ